MPPQVKAGEGRQMAGTTAHFLFESVGEAISPTGCSHHLLNGRLVGRSLALPRHPQFLHGMDAVPETPECH